MPLDQLTARNLLVDWQVAPAEHEIAHMDDSQIEYRKRVEKLIGALPLKSLRKKSFYTISTNVLCADLETCKESLDPIERDLYLPLEIAICKWSIAQAMENKGKAEPLDTKVWMINPGPATRYSKSTSEDHKKKHKIYFDADDEQNPFIEPDLNKLIKEINSYLSADRTVFSVELRHVRQDLGCLKWLNRQTGCKTKPITVLNIEDLYVLMIRRFNPEMVDIGSGIARLRLDRLPEVKGLEWQCVYHQSQAQFEDGETYNCGREKALHASFTTAMDTIRFGIETIDDDQGDGQKK